MTHDEAAELLGVLALHAVDPEEAGALAAHLADCARCRQELVGHEQVAALLGDAGGPAPAGLWASIESSIRSVEEFDRSLDLSLLATPRRGVRPVGTAGPDGVATHAGRRRSRRVRRSWAVQVGALAATAAAVALAVLGVQVAHLDHQINQSDQAGGTMAAVANQALLNPANTRIVLSATGGGHRPEAEIVTTASGAAFVWNRGLPALAAGRTYQLWAIGDGRTISVALLGGHPTTDAFTLDGGAPRRAFAITDEPAGGSISPSGTPVAVTAA